MANSWPKPKPAVPVALAILADATPAIPGGGEIPDPRPAKFYVVSVAGGVYANPAFTEPRVLVECWASDAATAEDMACTAMQAFKNARGKSLGGAFIHGFENEHGPTDYNDPAIQDRRRCQFFGDLLIHTS